MPIAPWFGLALVASLAGYAAYLVGLRRQLVQPNRASWLIWSAATAVEAATYAAVNPGAPQSLVFALAAAACVAVTLGLWRRSGWEPPSTTERACMAACLAALVLWLAFRQTFWAHMLVVVAVPVSFLPTWSSILVDRNRERSPAWGLWTVGDLATLLVAAHAPERTVGELAYILVELVCHASVWFIIGLATINPLRSLGLRRRQLLIVDKLRPGGLFSIEETHLGKAVFAATPFAEGQLIVEFTGERLPANRVPRLLRGGADRYVQVTPEQYMGPSGRIDDLINHSCAPNAGLRFADEGIFLVAARPIAAGEEISWDYSTTLMNSAWQMVCQCGAPECRGVIGNFATLSPERQEWFRARGFVAPYLRREAGASPRRAA